MFCYYKEHGMDYPYSILINGTVYAKTTTMDSVHATINAVKKDRPNDHIVFEVMAETNTEWHIYDVIYKEVHNG